MGNAMQIPSTDMMQKKASNALMETCLVLEFCDQGNLQDSVDRGIFNEASRDPLRGGSYLPNMTAVGYVCVLILHMVQEYSNGVVPCARFD